MTGRQPGADGTCSDTARDVTTCESYKQGGPCGSPDVFVLPYVFVQFLFGQQSEAHVRHGLSALVLGVVLVVLLAPAVTTGSGLIVTGSVAKSIHKSQNPVMVYMVASYVPAAGYVYVPVFDQISGAGSSVSQAYVESLVAPMK